MSSKVTQKSVNQTITANETSGAGLRTFLSDQIAPLSESEFKQLTEYFSAWKYKSIPPYEIGTEENLAQRKQAWAKGTQWDGLDFGSLSSLETAEGKQNTLKSVIRNGIRQVKESSVTPQVSHEQPLDDEKDEENISVIPQQNAYELNTMGDNEETDDEEDGWLEEVEEEEEDDERWSYSSDQTKQRGNGGGRHEEFY
ncbi:hypothetical protein TREMEDRAFT_58749 [Tremella mesenterica DSM 1558]|uniref:uncharacterized protein n=1 Tax=Tremella mesenterica (strain ATCC 24925 / CBS 8224 / DSM 1558 / NBRC 9311 / NRRL Y-6157 / RJB 2259-6 / UBC 559-6) TaxID=578456 RepID=UPI0003F498EB|nr:uncharacterized protein TREMEDRAFT_58749 [Tremella mesenterica DSM 1558]EIW72580.1 hypothetical protein TREMEDRAFT_58749 [Tremella mesenterica DSM 1558]